MGDQGHGRYWGQGRSGGGREDMEEQTILAALGQGQYMDRTGTGHGQDRDMTGTGQGQEEGDRRKGTGQGQGQDSFFLQGQDSFFLHVICLFTKWFTIGIDHHKWCIA